MEVRLLPAPSLPPSHLRLPRGFDRTNIYQLRLGTLRLPTTLDRGDPAPDQELWLAPDLWQALSIPWVGFCLQVRINNEGELELGPAVAVLFKRRRPNHVIKALLRKYFGHLRSRPGLLFIGFEEGIDPADCRMTGYLLDYRQRGAGTLLSVRLPIPSVVRLTWSHDPQVIHLLRRQTGNRVFNWVRRLSKWEQYRIFSSIKGVAEHLPQTRLLRSPADLGAMLGCHPVVYVKDVNGLRGTSVLQVRQARAGLQIKRIHGRVGWVRYVPNLPDVLLLADKVMGAGRNKIVQAGIPIVGRRGMPLDFRVLLVRKGMKAWQCLRIGARIAPRRLPFTNASTHESRAASALVEHLGLTPNQARAWLKAMVKMCKKAAAALGKRYDPLGILGFDVAVDAESHQIWLLEANVVPGWGYGPQLDRKLARSQVAYGIHLTGFAVQQKDR